MKTVLKAYWPTLKRHVWPMSVILFCTAMSVVANAIYPFLLRDFLEGFNSVSGGELIEWTLWRVFWLLVFSNAVWVVLDLTTAHYVPVVIKDLDRRSFHAIQAQSMRFFESSSTGSLITAAKRFSSSFEGIADQIIYNLGRSLTMIVLTFAAFVYERPMLALAFTFWITIYLAISIYFAVLRMRWGMVVAEKDSAVWGMFSDTIINQPAVKSFGMEREGQKRFDGITGDCYACRKSSYMRGMMLLRVQGISAGLFEFIVLYMLVQGWYNKTATLADFLGDFVFFQSYVLLLLSQIWNVGIGIGRVFRNVADAKQIAEIYFKEPEVKDAPGARPLIVEDGKIDIHAVNFKYGNTNGMDDDIRDFTLSIKPGQTVALVGHSGAGKTTLAAKLLSRFYDPNSGYIRIDGQDIANVTQLSLRQQVAVVPQDPSLFYLSIGDNISFARPDSTQDEIINAAKLAHAWEFIKRLPEGLNTLVGERGYRLSGGEKQRIALARAFLADAPILILDEATSALDSETEHEIQAAIADLLKNRTCIVIAHRLSTIRRADRIVVMEKGSITEDGTHEHLLRKKGVYAKLWALHSGYIE